MMLMLLPTTSFEVIAYRGAIVGSRDGWLVDFKSRGGFLGRVPDGFFRGVEAARFGTAPPYVYELPPMWLLIWLGVDVAADDFLRLVNYTAIAEAAENQRRDVAAIGETVGDIGNTLIRYLPALLYLAVILTLLYLGERLYRALK